VTAPDDFERAAAYLVKEHGEAASARATWLAEMYRAKGNVEGYQSWSRVASKVLDLLAESTGEHASTEKSITAKILDLLAEEAATRAHPGKHTASKTRRRKS